ncbi:hypothetical protein ATN84_24435 [Paramesorhizobium deserti]|uniref:Uncharacterized protein n=1 Tax=Paramesorhizobium deserti TaxID=1494590 RepID=A0A135HXQ1_9HYPH|nr:hypothetical protein [Paramesorhizobium deserti]KXF77965.1 hypothetical protein ATN84_24435 [Paramesorhizobium deserti]
MAVGLCAQLGLRQAREDFVKSGRDAKKLDLLKAAQTARREKAEAAQAAMKARHRHEGGALAQQQLAVRRQLRTRYLDEARRVKEARAAAKPTGLAAFLGRVTGVSFVISKLHKHRDAQRYQQSSKGESTQGGRGGDDGKGAVRRRQRTRRRDNEIAVPRDQAEVLETPAPNVPEPHWTELPLADEYLEAARDRDEVGDESGTGGRRIKPSRSKRGSERDDDNKDFERER